MQQSYQIPASNIKKFTDIDQAIKAIHEIYQTSIEKNLEHFKKFVKGEELEGLPDAFYPYVFVQSKKEVKDIDPRLAYGFVRGKGVFGTTITRPDLFNDYLKEQLGLLLEHNIEYICVGVSNDRIPIQYSFYQGTHNIDDHLKDLSRERIEEIPQYFCVPDISEIHDNIAIGTHRPALDEPEPLSLFTAERVDLSLQRLLHYTGTYPEHFQNYVLFTNYQFYVDEFVKFSKELMKETDDVTLKELSLDYEAFVEPGNKVIYNQNMSEKKSSEGSESPRMPQMPAYHLKRKNNSGITLVNIGVGPSNAKTITDHIAVLRIHCWLMLGHCAGLRSTQRLGDYVLAHGYAREDKVLDDALPLSVPIPPLAEIQQDLSQAVSEITGVTGFEMKKIIRTGTVTTVADRNWELWDWKNRDIYGPRSIGLDMESATIAGNGYLYRIPYGTFLCVSDKPLHGELKLPGMADNFYRNRVNQHLKIGIRALEIIRKRNIKEIHSRKLRSFKEPAFR